MCYCVTTNNPVSMVLLTCSLHRHGDSCKVSKSAAVHVWSGGILVCVLRVSEIDPEKPSKYKHTGAYLYVPDIYIRMFTSTIQFSMQYKGGCVMWG